MSGGSKNKEHPTDQQCPHCGLWFSPRGLEGGHKRNCPERETETESETTEETSMTQENEETVTGENIVCPNCGNEDNGEKPEIYYASSVLDKLGDKVNEEDRKTLRTHELLCSDCNTAFDN